MTALSTLLTLIPALDRELQPSAIDGYSDSELQAIFDSLEAVHEFKAVLQKEFSRREMTADNFVRS